MFTVALTGGVGSGKSTVAALLAQLGAAVIDADEIAHDLTATGSPVLDLITSAFGAAYVDADGRLDRAALRTLVFSNTEARKRLESILHPRIGSEMKRRLSQVKSAYAVLEIPLLFETGRTGIADRILVVDLPESEQIRRVQQRSGLEAAQIQHIIDSQAPRSQRLAGAHDIVDNSGDPGLLEDQVRRLHRAYLKSAATPGT